MPKAVRTLLTLTAAACLMLIGAGSALAYTGTLQIPPEGTTQKITLEDGSTLIGKITEIRADQIKFQTDLGEMTIAVSKIKEITEIKETTKIEETKPTDETPVIKETKEVPEESASSTTTHPGWFPNPNRTRLLVSQNARPLKAGEGYFFDIWVFFPGLAYGITDNISVAGGVSILPGVDDQLFYFTPKIGFPAAKNLDLAVNVTIFRLWEETFYLGQGNMTYGTDDMSFTLGLGLAWNDKEMADKPAVIGGGEYRVSRRASLVGEGWYVPGEKEDGQLIMAGVRFMGEQMTVDFGFATSLEGNDNADDPYYDENIESDEETKIFPYVDFVWNF
jgi:hypothetical protein